jgi:Nif-specific regulatory protein
LANHFVEKFAKANNKDVRRISTSAVDMLMDHHWPGNVRELENCIERAVLLSSDNVIHGHHLPFTLQTPETSDTMPRGALAGALSALEREMIQDALKATHGNMSRAARMLGMTERLIAIRVKRFRIDPKRFKNPDKKAKES